MLNILESPVLTNIVGLLTMTFTFAALIIAFVGLIYLIKNGKKPLNYVFSAKPLKSNTSLNYRPLSRDGLHKAIIIHISKMFGAGVVIFFGGVSLLSIIAISQSYEDPPTTVVQFVAPPLIFLFIVYIILNRVIWIRVYQGRYSSTSAKEEEFAFNSGESSFIQNKKLADNPYNQTYYLYKCWEQGWIDANEENDTQYD